jgi:tRNA(Ile)-lysidine synthase TilS/MesJ
MKICTQCVLPETFPGISFNKEGCCSVCSSSHGKRDQNKTKERFKQKFYRILEDKKNQGPYDALIAYSGGKDSTYTLQLLKEIFGLRICAITFDHGFVSPMALENIRKVTDNLDIDHIYIRPGAKTIGDVFIKSMAPNIYPIKALERASSICISCMNLVKSFLLKTAIEMRVPFVVYGWSPGQAPIQSSVFKTNPLIIRQMQKAAIGPLKNMIGNRLSSFFLEESHYETGSSSQADRFPYFIHPLAYLDYDEEHMLNSIKEIGWIAPTDTDSNSTNCLLNSLAIDDHIKRYGFHPYAFEIAGLVREGYMGREEGLKKLSTPPDPKIVNYVKKKLGIDERL